MLCGRLSLNIDLLWGYVADGGSAGLCSWLRFLIEDGRTRQEALGCGGDWP